MKSRDSRLKKLQTFFKRIYRRRSLFLAALLFILSATISPVVANVSSPTPIVSSQQDGGQLANKATALYRNGKFEEAATVWEQTATVFAAKGDGLNQAMALSNLSLTYQQLGAWDKATKAVEDSLGLLKTQPQENEKLKIQAQTLDVLGYLQRERGQSADALKTWQQAAQIYSQIEEKSKLAQSKINQAQIMQDMGLFPRACNTLLEVLSQEIGVQNCQKFSELSPVQVTMKLQKIRNQASSLPVVVALRSLGELLRFEGQLEKSRIILEPSLELAQKLNSRQEIAATYLSLGNTLRALSEGEIILDKKQKYETSALNYYNQAAKLSPSPTTRQQAQLNHLSFLIQLDQLPAAEELTRSLYPQLSSLSPSHTGVYRQINFAQSLVKLAQKDSSMLKTNTQQPSFNEIDQILVRAAEQAQSLGDKRAEAYALGNRGGVYEVSGSMQNLSRSEELTKQALRLASTFESPDISSQFFWQLGRIRRQTGDIQDAISAYTQAYNALQSLRNDLLAINPEIQFSFRDSVEPVYRELVALDLEYATSLKQAGKNEESKEPLVQARNVIESLQVAELNNFFREACVTSNPRQADEVDQTAAVIYTIVLKNQLNVILSLPTQNNQRTLSLHATPIEPKEFEETVEQVQRSLKTPVSNAEEFSRTYYKQLYDWLIEPLEAELASRNNIRTLAFVLDGNLRNIPMSVLFDGKQYLVEKYAVAVTPTLQLVDPKPITQINFTALTAGLSKINEEFQSEFQPLRNVELELKKIQEFGISSRLILNEQFTSKQIKQQIANARVPSIVHLATHGQFSSKANDTFILAWDRRIGVNDLGNILRGSSLSQTRPIELLVLSACETAVGDNRAALGLAGVAVRAGARSTLATLWRVEDQSTGDMMSEFYDQLNQARKNNTSKAEALRQAQLALLNPKNVRYKLFNFKHPHFWAPFVLVGNWQ
ncbi:CHAT domain-containing protein [Scytonema sp. UIC 10036]|uniref:CHAT domain-containing protein n=1 Tax=Scytonema sp. UIC 10036 TaxID=2304196 RepID=UPI0012DA827C|nr:CHAT domain-containing protein [Scytonema sp. UIC 10036]MUG92408.1 CHAT domain-containing protein [Scytonema sp. UIC 10036]